MSELVKLYNPANAAALTPEQLAGLQKLTSAEIKELAIAFPNMTMQRSYLLIIDSTKPQKQQPAPSTFQNLWNLREKHGLRNYVAFGFYGAYKSKNITPVVRHARSEVLDLSETELLSLPGFKTATKTEPPQQVSVTKIKKTVINPLEKSMQEINNLESLKPENQKKLIKLPPKLSKAKSK